MLLRSVRRLRPENRCFDLWSLEPQPPDAEARHLVSCPAVFGSRKNSRQTVRAVAIPGRRLAPLRVGFSIIGCAALIRFSLLRPPGICASAGCGPNINIAPPGRGLFLQRLRGVVSSAASRLRRARRRRRRENFHWRRLSLRGRNDRISEIRLRALQPLIEKPDLLSGAANGETVRTVAAVLGVHVGTVEAQVRPVHARRRVRRTAPGETARAHIAQAAGTAVAVTRSGVEVGSPPLSYSCTQRTGKPIARPLSFSGRT